MRIEVTQEDIDRGKRGKCSSCPVALAICRATGGRREDVRVGRLFVLFGTPGESVGVMLPEAAIEFVQRFDLGDPVAPFAFDWPRYDREIEATAAAKEETR